MEKVKRVFFAVPPQVHLLDISGPIHAFYEAGMMESGLETYFISTERGKPSNQVRGLLFLDWWTLLTFSSTRRIGCLFLGLIPNFF
ncbi:hypothetical protein V8V91_04465 [Algoriphagus halophilus]|uniref:hypothetical protein n=1 Tax=Algoriphagus halophilus TaxID=226505 RepID=UPI00358E33C8